MCKHLVNTIIQTWLEGRICQSNRCSQLCSTDLKGNRSLTGYFSTVISDNIWHVVSNNCTTALVALFWNVFVCRHCKIHAWKASQKTHQVALWPLNTINALNSLKTKQKMLLHKSTSKKTPQISIYANQTLCKSDGWIIVLPAAQVVQVTLLAPQVLVSPVKKLPLIRNFH